MNPAAYAAPPWLPGGHLRTLYPALLLRGPAVAYRRERWELTDGDFLDADWVDGPFDAPCSCCSTDWKAVRTARMRAT